MLKFEKFSVETLSRMKPYIHKNKSKCSDHSLGAVFMWHSEDIEFCVWNDTFVIHQTVGGASAFSLPVGKDVDGMIDELMVYARNNRLPLRFYAVGKYELEKISSDKRFESVGWTYDGRWSDYIYSFADAITFKGRKFSGQRNHINKFKRLYGEPDIRFVISEDLPEIETLLKEYELEHSFKNKLEKMEFDRTKELLKVYGKLGLYAACLRADGKIIAFSVGEIIDDMLIIHVEKALKGYQGVYPSMYNGFVRLIDEQSDNELSIVNREDDSGDPGLRASKEQYKPIGRVHKYLVHINSPASKQKDFPVIHKDGIVITGFRETDKETYLKINTDVDNNRFWGYDYREDAFITGEIDENTFYDFAMYDMKVGDSINFAIRLSEKGDMIGEGILWNFGADGSAELGCRIMPEYHSNGYGKKAFGAICDYAQNTLGMKVWARCYRNNVASYRMITSNNLHKVREDETFYYFERI